MSWRLLPFVLLVIAAAGCEPDDKPPVAPDTPPPPATKPKPIEGKKTALNKQETLFFEVMPDGQRRVRIEAAVCLREGPLELLLCRKGTKEHEAILHADIDAQQVHTALIAAKAKPGSPVKYTEERIIPPHGTPIKITLEYEKKPGEVVTIPANEWVRTVRNKKELDRHWVFAGSGFWKPEDEPNQPPFYLANNGNVVSVANFHDSMLDLPFASSKENAELAFECWTERIPPLGTKVTVILEPILEPEKN